MFVRRHFALAILFHVLQSPTKTLASVTNDPPQIAFIDHVSPIAHIPPPPINHLPSEEALNTLSSHERLQLIAHVATLSEPRLLEWSNGHREWRTEGEKALIIWHEKGRKFVDVTHRPFSPTSIVTNNQNILSQNANLPKTIQIGKDSLTSYFDQISLSRMHKRLEKFTSFRTRYYRSATGRDSQAWLHKQITSLVNQHHKCNVTVSEFAHPWGQNTIIARFEPQQTQSQIKESESEAGLESSNHHHPATDDDRIVVIGAHQDSTNLLPFLPAPGADDDGSGSMTILEAFNILLESQWQPSQGAVEFHWYSAEEGGMLGSGALTKSYAAQKKNVRSMLQFDMTAFVKKGTEERVGIVTDFVNPELSEFIRKLVDEYLNIPWVDTKCGYACSDHSSWTSIGVPSAFGIEASFEDSNTQNIHSTSDRLDVSDEFSFKHMSEFVRLALAYIMELSAK